MKKEASGKKGKWLWLVLGLVLLLAVVGVVLALVLGGGNDEAVGGRPELYWNVDKEANVDRDTGLSIREPAEDGNYYVRFAHDGEQVELPVADKKLVNYIDSLDLMSLKLDDDGYVVDIYPVKDVASIIGESLYVQNVSGDTLIANSSIMMNGRKVTINLNEQVSVYNVSGKGEFVGEAIDASTLNPMDTISIYGTLVAEDSEEESTVTHIYVLNKPAESEIYFRADQYYDSTNKVTTRVPDENGAYTIKWYCNGETLDLKCKDKDMVTTIDSANYHWCHWGLEFDEEGYIIDILDSFLASRTLMQCERYDITEVYDDGSYTATSLIKNNGAFVQGVVGADCPIYDISSTAKSEGQVNRRVDSLQLGDRVCIWTDTMGNPVHIYITRRQADSVGYWNVTRSYSSATKQTTREPNANGYYEIELLKAGDTKNTIYYTKDIEIATAVDKTSDRCVGLKVGEGNIIEYVYDIEAVFGYTYFVRGYYILDATASVCTYLTPSGSGYTKNGVLGADAKVWNVSTVGEYGAETTLQVGDYVYAGKTPTGEVSYAYVVRRPLENGANKFYWRIDARQYDSKNKVTTREPDAEGYYVFQFAHNGEIVTLKTKNKDFATMLDYQSSAPAFALEVKGDIIVAVHDGTYAYGGTRINGWTVTAINGNEITAVSSSGVESTYTLVDGYKCYNVSSSVVDHKGEATTLKVGDVIAGYRNMNAQIELVIVKTRRTNKMAWPVDPQTDRQAKDGWYYIDLAVDGKIQTFKCKSKYVVDAIDAYTSPFGIQVSGNEILYMSTTTYVEGVKGSGVTTVTVESASSSSVKILYTLGKAEKVGTTETLTLASGAKIYDVSPEAEAAGKFGTAVKLKKGDVIRTYKDADGNQLYIYVIAHQTKDYYSYCPHCDKPVYWTPYAPSSNATTYDSHYYLATDLLDMPSQIRVYSTSRDYEIVLDLNGHTASREGGRAALVRYGDTLTLIDTSADKSGKIMTKNNTSNGGVIMVSGSKKDGIGVLNIGAKVGNKYIYGGTITLADGGEQFSPDGGLITNSGTVNLYDGKLLNGIAKSKEDGASGGAINTSGTFNMYGGEITGGKVEGWHMENGEKELYTGAGGNISSSGTTNIYGGIIQNGIASRGGNVSVTDGTFTLHAGQIINGTADLAYGKTTDARGGNIFSTGDVYIKGGTVSGGKVVGKDYGGNIMSTGLADTIYISGGTVSGGTYVNGETTKLSNIYLMYSNVEVSGGTIDGGELSGTLIGGTGTNTGGYCTITISGGTIKGNVNGGGNVTKIEKDASGQAYYISEDKQINVYFRADGSAYTLNSKNKEVAFYPDYRSVINLKGGKVEGTVNAGTTQQINVSGNPVVGLLKFGGNKLNVGTMSSGANITIEAVGIFSEPMSSKAAADAVVAGKYFKSTNEELILGASSANELKIFHPDAYPAYCEHCGGEADWIPTNVLPTAAGHYALTADVTVTEEAEIVSGTAAVLDLAGHTVTCDGSRAFNVKGTLSIVDSSEGETGVITGGTATRGGNIYVSSGIFEIYSGTIANGVADNELGTSSTNGRGGNIFSTGDVYLYGGTVTGGSATNGSGYGGNIVISAAESVLYIGGDAVVSDGTAKSGGNIYLMYSSLLMDGGTISGGSATSGGNLCTNGTATSGGSMVIIYGGTVTDGSMYLGGSVGEVEGTEVDYRTYLEIGGGNLDCVVSADKIGGVTLEDEAGNELTWAPAVYLVGSPVIRELKLGTDVLLNAALTEGASVTVNAAGVISVPYADKAYAESLITNNYIVPQAAGVELIVNDQNELEIRTLPVATEQKYCEHCQNTVEFKAWSGIAIAEDGHYFLEADLQLTDVITIANDVVIDLNGHTITAAENSQVFNVSGSLSIQDSSENETGAITGGSGYRGGNIYVTSSGNFTLYSGSITNGVADTALGSGTTGGRGGNIFGNGGTVTLKGGTVSGGSTVSGSNWGGNIFMTGGTLTVEEGAVLTGGNAKNGGNIYLMYADMVMTGGEIVNGTASSTATGIYLNGTASSGYSSLTISGGLVDGSVYSANAANTISVSGTAQITSLDLNGTLLNIGEMADNASIKIDATSGVFTDVLTNANAVVGYFDAVDSAYNVAVSADNKLEIVADSASGGEGGGSVTPPEPSEGETKNIFCQHCQQNVEFTKFTLTENSAGDAYTAVTGHYFLAEDLSLTMQIAMGSSKDVVVDLNGKTITASGCRAFSVSGGATLSIQDTVGTGVITGGNSNGGRGGNIYATGGNLCLYGGKIYGGTAAADYNNEGHDVAVYDGELTVNGDVQIGQACETGHAVYVFSATGLNLTKGTITGGLYLRTMPSVSLGNGIVIDSISLRGSSLTAVGSLTLTEKIAVKIINKSGELLEGTFTSALNNAETALTYFEAAGSGYKVEINSENALVIVADTTSGGEGDGSGEGEETPDVPATGACPHCDGAVWTAWDGATVASGHYYLTQDIALESMIKLTGEDVDVVIDLRGFDITVNGLAHVFDVRGGATLSICDTVGGGVISGADNATGSGGNIYAYEATFNLYGGTITGGSALKRGGNIYGTSATVNIYGGTVSRGTITEGAGANLFIMQGTLTISGDAVIENSGSEAVYVQGTSTKASGIIVSGGKVIGEMGLKNVATVEISGNPEIEKLTLDGSVITTVGTMTDGASVKVNATEGVVTAALADADAAAAALVYIDTVAHDKILVANANNELEVAEGCPCGCKAPADSVVWQDANAYIAALSQKTELNNVIGENVHLRLSADLNITEIYGAKKQISIGADVGDFNVTIDLNGYTWSSDYRMYNYEGCTLTVLDTSAEQDGTMISAGRNTNAHGGVFANYGTLNIYSGTFTQPADASNVLKGGVIYQSKGVLNLYGGTITGGHTVDGGFGGNIHIYAGTFNMYGGTISNGNAKGTSQGGNVYIRHTGTFNVYGGTITGGSATEGADVYLAVGTETGATLNVAGGEIGEVYVPSALAAVNVSETAVIENVILTGEAVVTPGILLDGASIGVTKDTAFTGVLADPESVQAYFVGANNKVGDADAEGKLILVDACACGCGAPAADVTWLDANAYVAGGGTPVSAFTADGHYKLSADLNVTEIFGAKKQITVGDSEGTVCNVVIDLNGYTWSSTHRLYVYAGAELTIMDSSENETGKLTSTGNSGSGRVIINYGTVNLRSGTITMTAEGAATIATGGIVYNTGSSVFNMYGGSIVNGVADGDAGKGGNLYVRNGTTFNMYGGTISGGTAALGSNIYIDVTGTFNYEAGTIDDQANTIYQAV